MVRAAHRRDEPDLRADRARALKLVAISADVALQLDRFVGLLQHWQSKINLIGASTLNEIWTRHIADSLQLPALVPGAKIWIDLGSGGGFPGVPIACALGEGATVHLVESNAKKAAFLREAGRILNAPIIVHAMRIEEFTATFRERADVVTARALAPLAKLLDLASPLLKTGAKAVFPKGQDVEVELTEAAKCWTIDSTLVPSKTDPAARILVIHSAVRRDKQ